jgi:hypothetical protein
MTSIEIIVQPNGKASVQTLGFVGPSCREASKFIEQALGQQIAEQRTVEFYQSEAAQQSLRQPG